MSFDIVAANAPSFSDWLNPGLSPRMDLGSYPNLNARNTSTTRNNTVNLFLDSTNSKFEYGGSVISACVDQTVYAIQCTSGPATVGTATCGPRGATATLTIGASNYQFSSAVTAKTLGVDVTATVQETCVLAGTTAATCTATVKATADGTSTTTSAVETLTGRTYYRFDVEITGGAENTASPTATCAVKSAAAGPNTKKMAIWTLASVMGVAGILTIL